MIINIPDEILENQLQRAFGKMPPTKNNKPNSKIKSVPVLEQIDHEFCRTDHLYIIAMIIYRAILKEIIKRKIILYSPETDTWQGVDFDGN